MKKKKGESGFALLLVFAMAATIALLAYIELPRVAFERQREKEELLIERGEEYKRAIQLYFRKFKTYPTSLDSLENTNQIRFLRRRYADPLTGKDDWRLIHIGPGGVFTDSLTNKPKGDPNQQTQSQNNFITEGASLAAPDAQSTSDQSNPALRRRPSDGGQPVSNDPNAPVLQSPTDPGSAQGQTPAQLGLGQSPAPPAPPGPGQQPGTPGTSPSPVSGLSGIPGLPGGAPTDPNAPQPTGTPTDPNAPGTANPSQNPNPFGPQGFNPSQSGSNAAADLIRGLLTQPRSMPTGQPTLGAGGTQIASGSIAGVASKLERRGIKVYHEREKYNEWEFIYDFSKDRTGAGRMAGMMGAGQGQQPGQNQPGQVQPGQQPGNSTGFGGQSGFGGAFNSGFGTQPQQPSGPGMQAGPLPPTTTTPQQ